MAGTAEKTDPKLWDRVKKEVTGSEKGGRRGQWSARKAQLATSEYKKKGGGYKGAKKADNHLSQWTEEEWGTKSGRTSRSTGERYLPRKAREKLSDEEYGRTTAKKRKDTAKGEQFSGQPADVAKKTAGARRTGTRREAPPRRQERDRAQGRRATDGDGGERAARVRRQAAGGAEDGGGGAQGRDRQGAGAEAGGPQGRARQGRGAQACCAQARRAQDHSGQGRDGGQGHGAQARLRRRAEARDAQAGGEADGGRRPEGAPSRRRRRPPGHQGRFRSDERERDAGRGTRLRVRGQHDGRRDARVARHGAEQRGRLDPRGRGGVRRPPVRAPHPRDPGARRRRRARGRGRGAVPAQGGGVHPPPPRAAAGRRHQRDALALFPDELGARPVEGRHERGLFGGP